MLQNRLLLDALQGKPTERTPVWMMRQAGRYLPEYQELRRKYSFFERCEKPELATEITIQPIDIIGVDAAILFSDILVVPQAMGLEVQMVEQKGPILPNPIKTEADLLRVQVPDVHDRLHYVMDAIKLTKQELNNRVPLIGFAGSPWTLLCYMVQGKGSKTFDEAKTFVYTQPALAHKLLQMITDTTIAYLKAQVAAGADAVQVFDSWGGLLSKADFAVISLPYLQQIAEALNPVTNVTLFAKGAWHSLAEMKAAGAHCLGIDWCIEPQQARAFAGDDVTLQGNFDPAKLTGPRDVIVKETKAMLQAFGPHRHIANLGHGILPNVPVDNARAFVDTVKEFRF